MEEQETIQTPNIPTEEQPITSDMFEAQSHSEMAVLVKNTNTMTLNDTFANNFHTYLLARDADSLKDSYSLLSEVEDVDQGKRMCYAVFRKSFAEMMSIVKNPASERTLVYYVWHLLQLMTCCPQIKETLSTDTEAITLLLSLHKKDMWSAEECSSLTSVTLNYVLIMLADADDAYYEFIQTTNLFPFLHTTLQNSSMYSADPHFELTLLALNLLLEGSSGCKQKLLELNFKELISRAVESRCDDNYHENMLMVTKQTYEKFLLLESDSKSFVETFRYSAKEEIRKDTWFGGKSCANPVCEEVDERAVTGVEVSNLKYCSRCKVVTYCSKECQIAHWKAGHSKACKKMKPPP